MPLRDIRGLKKVRIKMLMNPNGTMDIRVSLNNKIITNGHELETPEQIINFVDVCYDLLARGA
jgi:hypothetical protein